MSLPNLSLFLIMACFWATLWLVQRFLIVPLGAVLKERREHIEGAEEKWTSKNEEFLSATSRLEAEMEEAAREAASIRNEFLTKAMSQRQETLNQARDQADKKLESALVTLDQEAESAREDLRQHASKLARLFASRLLDRDLKQEATP